MSRTLSVVTVVGLLSAIPTLALAQVPQAPGTRSQISTKSISAAKTATTNTSKNTHATNGTVKAVNDSSLVITTHSKKHHEMTFAMQPSTRRDGTIAVGSSVSVRYRNEGSSHVALAVAARAHA